MVRSPDAPVFGIDVSLQKARTAAFISNPHAASDLGAAGQGAFVTALRNFFGDQTALTGATAFGVRSVGNLSRPFFPDGQDGQPNGPLSYPYANWSPFATGLQSHLVVGDVVQHIGYVGGAASDAPARCTGLPDAAPGQNRLQNGLQIFSGGVPIYRNNRLVGAIGVSGDGVDQDDMIAFLGLSRAGTKLGTIGNAPAAIRADQITIGSAGGARLRYVSCPFQPFLDSDAQNVCQGL
jgi:uncharacterized protein GlcG (DUF336 family)